MDPLFPLPSSFFQESGTRRLRIDDTMRSLVASAKAHGVRPASHVDWRFPAMAINLVLRGRGRYVEESGRTHQLGSGVLFHRYPGVLHSTWFDPASDYAEFFVVLDAATGRQLMSSGLLSAQAIVHVGVDPVMIEECRHLMKRIRLPENQLPSTRVLLEAISFINDLYDRARRNRVLDPWQRVVEDACQMLEHNLDERLPTSAIAERLGVSYAAFRKHFKEATGYAPADYRIRRRLEAAQHALMAGSVQAAAQEFGYGDAYSFSTQFKAFVGVSPREFQRRMKTSLALVPLTHRARNAPS